MAKISIEDLEPIPATKAKVVFGEIIHQTSVEGKKFVVYRHGKPVSVILSYNEYDKLVENVKKGSNAKCQKSRSKICRLTEKKRGKKMAKIEIKDLPQEMKVSSQEMRVIMGGRKYDPVRGSSKYDPMRSTNSWVPAAWWGALVIAAVAADTGGDDDDRENIQP